MPKRTCFLGREWDQRTSWRDDQACARDVSAELTGDIMGP